MNGLNFSTVWTWEHWFWNILLNQWTEKNLCVLEGRNHAIEIVFGGGTQITNWYVAPFEDNHNPASGDNYAAPGFSECIAYDETTRPGFQGGSVSGGIIDNSANRASFTFNEIKTIFGAALVGGGADPDTKGDNAGGGILFCESKFSTPENVIIGSVLKVKIEITLSAA
jgi:hypothetical protein